MQSGPPLRQLLPLLLCAVTLWAAPVGAEESEALERARAYDERAQALFSEGDYTAALAEMAAAQALLPSSTRVYNMARCYDRMGNASQAIRLYREFIGASNTPTERRVRAADRIAALQSTLDSAAEAASASPEPVETAPPPEAPQRERRRLSRGPFFATLGVTAAVGIAAVILGPLSALLDEEFQGLTQEDPRADELARRGPAVAIAADVMIGLFTAGAVATVVLVAVTRWRQPRGGSARLRLAPQPGGFATGIEVRF